MNAGDLIEHYDIIRDLRAEGYGRPSNNAGSTWPRTLSRR